MSKRAFQDKFVAGSPIVNGIIVRRQGGKVLTNVRHRVTLHSPTGFSFGYAGSGPADLALNIAEAVLVEMGYSGRRVPGYRGKCFYAAMQMHQDLKRVFIECMSGDGATLDYSVVENFVFEKLKGIKGDTV